MSTSETIGEAIERTGGRSSGFDFLRLGLSVAVLVWHSFRVSYADFSWDGWYRPVVALILPMFFALSGFLVSGSLARVRSIHEFLMLRAMRIVPALAVEIALSALLIGTLFTTLPLNGYFADPQYHDYFRNIYGDIHFSLPGVFQTNPLPAVNLSLWTIPYELECYVVILALWVFGVIRKPARLLAVIVLIQIALPIFDHYRGSGLTMRTPIPGRVLILAFLFGVLFYFYRDRVRLKVSWAVAAMALSLVMLSFNVTTYLIGLPAAYLTVYLGMLNPRRPFILTAGDYSYGIYLYSFPLQQMFTALLPNAREWWVNVPLALLASAACAVFSWHVVEKPVLSRRKQFIGLGDMVFTPLTRRWRTTVARNPPAE